MNSKAIKQPLLVLLLLAFTAPAFAGGTGGGGGTYCINPAVNKGRPVLLDLADKYVNDKPSTGTRFYADKLAKVIGFDRIDLTHNVAYQMALAAIHKWSLRPSSENSMHLVEIGLETMPFYETPLEIKTLSRIYLAPNSICKKSDLYATILYKDGADYISIPAWNRLGLLSQTAMLVHEALRTAQIMQKLDGSDADLQRLTKTIAGYYDNGGSTHLDNDPFFAKYIMKVPATYQKNACAKIKGFLAQYPQFDQDALKRDAAEICTMNIPADLNAFTVKPYQTTVRNIEIDFDNVTANTENPRALLVETSVYNSFDDLVSALLHQTYSNDDYDFFRPLTIAMNQTTFNTTELVFLRDYVNDQIQCPISWSQNHCQHATATVSSTLNNVRKAFEQFLNSPNDQANEATP